MVYFTTLSAPNLTTTRFSCQHHLGARSKLSGQHRALAALPPAKNTCMQSRYRRLEKINNPLTSLGFEPQTVQLLVYSLYWLRYPVSTTVDYVCQNVYEEWYALCSYMPAGGGLINMLHMTRADLWQVCHLLFHSSKSVYTYTHTHTPLQPTNTRQLASYSRPRATVPGTERIRAVGSR